MVPVGSWARIRSDGVPRLPWASRRKAWCSGCSRGGWTVEDARLPSRVTLFRDGRRDGQRSGNWSWSVASERAMSRTLEGARSFQSGARAHRRAKGGEARGSLQLFGLDRGLRLYSHCACLIGRPVPGSSRNARAVRRCSRELSDCGWLQGRRERGVVAEEVEGWGEGRRGGQGGLRGREMRPSQSWPWSTAL